MDVLITNSEMLKDETRAKDEVPFFEFPSLVVYGIFLSKM